MADEQDSMPEIVLRIPGPWGSMEELRDRLLAADAGYVLARPQVEGELWLKHKASGRRFRLSVAEADDELVQLFADSPRVGTTDLDALARHKVKVFVTGPGGSHEAARTFLAIGEAFIKAGAMGIMVDNSGNCHSPQDWLDLTGDTQMGGMYWAFVSVTACKTEVFSAGMHCLGYRDAEMPDPVDPKSCGMMMHEFLGYSYQSGVPIVDGDPIGGLDGPEFILRHVECTRFDKDMPWFNPYGVWRLEKVEAEE